MKFDQYIRKWKYGTYFRNERFVNLDIAIGDKVRISTYFWIKIMVNGNIFGESY